MIIYLDENLPKYLAEGFHILQYPEGIKNKVDVEVKHLSSDFGFGIKDEDWIPELGKINACIITQDIRIQRRKHEMELYKKHGVGIFFLRPITKKTGLTIWQMVETLAKRWPEIIKIATEEVRPFGYEFSIKKKLQKIG